jgi:hypothetical protein
MDFAVLRVNEIRNFERRLDMAVPLILLSAALVFGLILFALVQTVGQGHLNTNIKIKFIFKY